MPPVVPVAIAAVGAVAGGIGKRKQQKKQNQYARDAAGMMSPESIRAGLQTANPQLYNAAYGQNPFEQWQQPTSNWADWVDQQSAMSNAYNANPMAALFHAPGYIDPRIMNQSLNMNAAGAQGSLQAGIAQMGRSAMMGGMADAFAMANKGMETRNRMGIMQNYDIDRANRTRSDISQGQGMLNQAYTNVGATQGAAAGFIANQQAPQNWMQIGSQAISSGLSAYGGMQGIGGGGTSSFSPNTYQQPSTTQQMNYGAPSGGYGMPAGGYGSPLPTPYQSSYYPGALGNR